MSKKEFPSPEQRISEPGNTGSCEKSYNFTKHPQRRRFSAFPASPEIAPNETLAICNFAIRKQKGTQCKLRLAIAQMIQTERSTRTFSLLSSETAHQNLHRLQKPDEQAKSREKAWGFYDPFHNHRATLSKDILAFTSPLSGGRDVNAFVQKP